MVVCLGCVDVVAPDVVAPDVVVPDVLGSVCAFFSAFNSSIFASTENKSKIYNH